MVLFVNDSEGKVAIPDSRIYKIICSKNKIKIYYDSGDVNWLNDTIATKQITEVSATFNNEELAVENFRAYFQACEKNKGAFYFG